MTRLCANLFAGLLAFGAAAPLRSQPAPKAVPALLESHCFECHNSDLKKGGLDLTALKFETKNPDTFGRWVQVLDRVSAGEMPPKKKPRPQAAELRAFTNSLYSALLVADRGRVASEGRAIQRRLN